MRTLNDLCVFTSICEEDAYWLPQYLGDLQRVGLRFCMHFDRCSDQTKQTVVSHPMYVGHTEQNNKHVEFTEKHKQSVFDLVQSKGYAWSMAMDSDETHETNIGPKLVEAMNDAEKNGVTTGKLSFYYLWDNWKQSRVDGPFGEGAYRDHLYRLDTKWTFRSGKVNGPSRGISRVGRTRRQLQDVTKRYPLVRLHWGLMTEGLRRHHKERWDRIYGKQGGNTYQIWNHSLDPQYVVEVREHGLLNHLPSDYAPPIPENLK